MRFGIGEVILESGMILRGLSETDGPGISALSTLSADGGVVSFTPEYQIDPFKAAKAAHGEMQGVCICAPGSDEMIGVGLVRFGRCQYEGENLPYGLLNTLIVHPKYRRMGIASRIARWRIEQVRERYGMDAVIMANIQEGNTGSLKTAAHWFRQIAGPVTYQPIKVRGTAPRPQADYTVRPARATDLDAIAGALNTFYQDYSLYPPETGASLDAWLHASPFDTPIHHYYVVVDQRDSLLAGMAVTDEYRLRTLRLLTVPRSIALVDKLLHLLPVDGQMREAFVDRVWFRPGALPAARYLLDCLLWEQHGSATNLSVAFDPRGALRDLFPGAPWRPSTRLHVAIQAPEALPANRLIYPIF